jgi:hypothetical protein
MISLRAARNVGVRRTGHAGIHLDNFEETELNEKTAHVRKPRKPQNTRLRKNSLLVKSLSYWGYMARSEFFEN